MKIIETHRGLAVDLAIKLPLGVHARPSARLSQTARSYDADILIISEDGEVDAKSMLDILSLALKHNEQVRLLARGPEAREALAALHDMLTASGD